MHIPTLAQHAPQLLWQPPCSPPSQRIPGGASLKYSVILVRTKHAHRLFTDKEALLDETPQSQGQANLRPGIMVDKGMGHAYYQSWFQACHVG